MTLREKIVNAYHAEPRLFCREYLAPRVQASTPATTVNEWPNAACLIINGRILAQPDLAQRIPLDLDSDAVFINEHDVIAVRADASLVTRLRNLKPDESPLDVFDDLPHVSVDVDTVAYPWDLLSNNGRQLELDAYHLHEATFGVEHEGKVHQCAVIEWPDRVTIEQGAEIKPAAVLDAEHGPIVIARGATVMAGAFIEGPAYVGPYSTIKAHGKIYGKTTIGPVCKVGGEVECSIIHGFSNKQHEGFLGHSYLGEWINIGAGTDNSDLKNNYSTIRMKVGGDIVDTGLTFVGMFVGDHTKTAIGSTINTGSNIGPCCNLYGAGLAPKIIPAFAWGGPNGFTTYDIEKCMEVARTVMRRRNQEFGQAEEMLFRSVFEMTAEDRIAAGSERVAVR